VAGPSRCASTYRCCYVGTPLCLVMLALREQQRVLPVPAAMRAASAQHTLLARHGFLQCCPLMCCRWTRTRMLSLFAAAARRSASDAGKTPTAPAPVSWPWAPRTVSAYTGSCCCQASCHTRQRI
jgi:hypothetical protein